MLIPIFKPYLNEKDKKIKEMPGKNEFVQSKVINHIRNIHNLTYVGYILYIKL